MAWGGASPNRTRGRIWGRLRARVLADEPYCRICLQRGRGEAANRSTICDHIKPLAEGGTDARWNLAGVCSECHTEKTLTEAARARGSRPPRFKVAIGADGWPVDDR